MFVFAAICGAFVAGTVAWEEIQFYNAKSFNNSANVEAASAFDRLFDIKASQIAQFTNDYARWEEMVRFTRKPDSQWATYVYNRN